MSFTKEIDKRFLLQEEYLGLNKPVNKIVPLVSISVAAYQHEPYISQCIEGILMQQTDFLFEIILGEDDSQDGTRQICIDYAEKYPDKIRLFLRDRNISLLKDENGKLIKILNGVLGFSRMSARGKYIALCEGDDYWTDPEKLQKQVNFLQKNQDFVLCSGNALKFNQNLNQNTGQYCHWKNNKEFDYRSIISDFYAPTHTVMFKNIMPKLPDFYYEVLGADRMFYFLLSKEGKFYFFKDIFGTYRTHDGGISSVNSKSDLIKLKWEENSLRGLLHFRSIALKKQLWTLDKHIVNGKLAIITLLIKCKRKSEAFKQLLGLIFHRGLYNRANLIKHFKLNFKLLK